MLLSQLQIGETRKIKQLGSSLEVQFRKRLLAMGLKPSAYVTLVRKAPFGDPLQIETSGIRLAIRSSLAKEIVLEAA